MPRLQIASSEGGKSQIDPEELLQRARDGDMRVGRLLFDRYQSLVNRRVRRVLGRDREHDDIVQNVFMAVFRGLASVQEPRSLDFWVLGITHNTILRELRRRKFRWPWTKREPEILDLVDDAASSVEALETRQLLDRTYLALKQLPARQHLAYTLSILEERPLAEIATACACSLATVKREITDARARLRRLVERDPVLSEYLRSIEEGR